MLSHTSSVIILQAIVLKYARYTWQYSSGEQPYGVAVAVAVGVFVDVEVAVAVAVEVAVPVAVKVAVTT